MSQDAAATVRLIVSAVCGRDATGIKPGDRLDDLGVDSLDRVLLAVLVERESGRPFPDDVLAAVTTVADIQRHVTRKDAAA